MLVARHVSRIGDVTPFGSVVLDSGERHLRRKRLTLQHGDEVLVDLAAPATLTHGDRLVLEDGRHVEVIAADEPLLEVRAAPGQSIAVLAWHLGNRHLPAQIEAGRILIARDHVIADMLTRMGAAVRDVMEPFNPERGAYHGTEHGHGHGHHHGEDTGHNHHGRTPSNERVRR
ncbi:MAG: urease accessory protein UreE [Hyphomicrobiaceae bacterium]